MRYFQNILVAFVIFLFVGCIDEQIDGQNRTLEDSKEIAQLFVMNSPTYKFDGNNIKFIDSNSLMCKNCYIFIYEFNTEHAGFGDRHEDTPIEAKTDHKIDVIVQKGEVIQAIIDNTWNEIKQRPIQSYEMINGEKVSKIPVYYCSKPRPEICTLEHDPVCSDLKEEYSSGCSACSKKSTTWYTKGQCNLGYTEKAVTDITKGKITKESGPVLVLIGWHLNDQVK